MKTGKHYDYADEIERNAWQIDTSMKLKSANINLNYSQKKYKEHLWYTEQEEDWVEDS